MVELNNIFAFFLKQKGISPKMKKTKYGYRTYDSKWKAFEKSEEITFMRDTRTYNGYDYDDGIEETKYQIKRALEKISIVFVYTKDF